MNDNCSCVGCLTLIICIVLGYFILAWTHPLKVGDMVRWGDATEVEYTGIIIEKTNGLYKINVTQEYRFVNATGGGNGYINVNYTVYKTKSEMGTMNHSGSYPLWHYIVIAIIAVVVVMGIAGALSGGGGSGGFSAK